MNFDPTPSSRAASNLLQRLDSKTHSRTEATIDYPLAASIPAGDIRADHPARRGPRNQRSSLRTAEIHSAGSGRPRLATTVRLEPLSF